MLVRLVSSSPLHTAKMAAKIAQHCEPGCMIKLFGFVMHKFCLEFKKCDVIFSRRIGTGKSVFARALIQTLVEVSNYSKGNYDQQLRIRDSKSRLPPLRLRTRTLFRRPFQTQREHSANPLHRLYLFLPVRSLCATSISTGSANFPRQTSSILPETNPQVNTSTPIPIHVKFDAQLVSPFPAHFARYLRG